MRNFEKMKESLCKQIQAMDMEQMEQFTDHLEEWNDRGISLFAPNGLFSCEICEKVFGKCRDTSWDNFAVCSGRFRQYAEMEEGGTIMERIRKDGTLEYLHNGDVVQHFKRERISEEEKKEDRYLYRILCVATDTETERKCVIYQAMYGDFGVYSRSMDMFLSKVDHNKYPDIQQEYRFEKVEYTENEWKKLH